MQAYSEASIAGQASIWKYASCGVCWVKSAFSIVPLIKSFAVITLIKFMSPKISKALDRQKNPITFLKTRAGDAIVKKLPRPFRKVWKVVRVFIPETPEDEPYHLKQYHVELSELTA